MRKTSVEAVLRKSRARASRADDILAALRSKPVPTAPGIVEAVSDAAGMIVEKLEACNDRIKKIRKRIKETLDRIKSGEGEDGRAVEILESVPGIGAAVPAVIVSEAFGSIRRADRRALRCCLRRRAGRQAVGTDRPGPAQARREQAARRRRLHQAMAAARHDDISRAKYRALRSRGCRHARALRSVADRLLGVVCRMLETG